MEKKKGVGEERIQIIKGSSCWKMCVFEMTRQMRQEEDRQN